MFMNQRTQVVYSLLAEYVRSPSLRHMREERSLAKLALEIVTKLDRDSSVWKKWEGPRDKILGAAIECWIPCSFGSRNQPVELKRSHSKSRRANKHSTRSMR